MNAPNRIPEIKAALTAAAGILTGIFGWVIWPVLLWIVLMAADYVTGTLAAKKAGEWSSTIARDGLWHKGGSIAIVFVSEMADMGVSVLCSNVPMLSGIAPDGICLLLPIVVAWYIITELGSIAENAAKMGAPVPAWLISWLAKARESVDEAAAGNTKEEK